MNKVIAASLLWIALVLSACSPTVQFTAAPNSTASFTAPPFLTSTVAPPETLLPTTETLQPVALLLPEGQPASEWKGIPIMPGAIAGEGDDEGYVFTVRATPQQVNDYYDLELGQLGWQPLTTGDGDSSLMLMFMDSTSATLTISIIVKGDDALVLLVK